MKRIGLAVVAAILLGVAIVAMRSASDRGVSIPPPPVAAVVVEVTPIPSVPLRVLPSFPAPAAAAASPGTTPGSNSRTAGSPLAAELNAQSGSPERDVQVLHEMLRQYLRLLHSRQGLPIGNDTDLLRALTGHNPMKLVILPPDHSAVGADRRLRDRWGTPYAIHPRGNSAYEIRSAGPDRKLFTADDLAANPAPAAAPAADDDEAPGEATR